MSASQHRQSEELHEQIKNSMLRQLEELDLLQSMYPNPGEIILSDRSSSSIYKKFIETNSEFLPDRLYYIIMLTIEKLKLEVCVDLPYLYPNEEPDVLVRCNQLNRKQQTQLNSDLTTYLKSLEKGEPCIYSLIMWLQENSERYWVDITLLHYDQDSLQEKTTQIQFARYWIYSHHIYNKRKRVEISQKAREMDLTGFCLAGKPGIICVEGDEGNCKDWWRIIKSMTWKKITLRKIEILDSSSLLANRKFSNFEEILMDMSTFSKYLQDHNVPGNFQEIFGLSTG